MEGVPGRLTRLVAPVRNRRKRFGGRRHSQQRPAEGQLRGTMAVGEEPVMADAVEAIGQGVEQEASDELVGVEGDDLRLAVMPIILPAEADPAIGQADQAGVGDGDAVRVAAEIGQHLFGAAEGRLGVDDPLELAALGQSAGEGVRFGEPGEIADKLEMAGLERGLEFLQEQPAEESTRTGRKKPGRQATQRLPSGEGPPPGTMQWTWGWCCSVWPQVCSTATQPTSAPKCLGSAARVRRVSAAARNRMA